MARNNREEGLRAATAALAADELRSDEARRCRYCGCTDDDCTGCVERTGGPCWWVSDDLCSACAGGAS